MEDYLCVLEKDTVIKYFVYITALCEYVFLSFLKKHLFS